MKNGRFSEKKTGKRWLTSTWNASLSTWLKSGLTVASSVIVDVSPNLRADSPTSRSRRRTRAHASACRASAAPE